MATIVEFRSGGLRSQERDFADFESAEIIIFPGVRRERHVESPKARRRDKARPKRDRLELPD